MKQLKIIGIIAILGMAVGLWIIGCTGEGAFDITPMPTGSVSPIPSVTPSGTPTVTPTVGPTPTGTPASEKLEELATARANSFDLKIHGGYLYWVERSTTPSGGVFRINQKSRQRAVEQVVTGLNNPTGLYVSSSGSKDYLWVSVGEGSTGGVIYRVDLSSPNYPKTQLTSGMQGNLTYMTGDIFFTRDAGGGNSAVHYVNTFPSQTPAIADTLDSNVTNAYDVISFTINSSGQNSERFVIVTERISAPNGRVLIYDLSGGTTFPVTPTEVASGLDRPTRVTFQPIYQSDNMTPVYPMQGYVYWTNYDVAVGQVNRQKISYDTTTKKVTLVGSREVVAKGLRAPYAIKAPNDMCSGPLKGTLNKLLVSSNLSAGDGGNWYVIDVSNPSSFPMDANSPGVTKLIGETVNYPLNGVFTWSDNQIEGFFTSFNDATNGNNDGKIYHFLKKLK